MQECVLCEEYITNPLCPECICAQVTDWLREFKPELVSGLVLETSKMSLGLFNENSCIKCSGFMDVCTYCYTKHILEWLKTQKVTETRMSEFITFFHFDLEKKGYLSEYVQT